MAFALDTNVLIYAHMEQYPQHPRVREFLTGLLEEADAYFMSWQIVYEYIRLVTHPRIHRVPLTAAQAADDLKPYLRDPRCRLLLETENHQKTLESIFKELPSAKGNFIHDCRYAALLKEHAVREIVTADTDFKKFSFLKVIHPFS